MNRFEFGRLVASLRDDYHWTQADLARRSGVDISIISNIERGERKTLIKDDILTNLADGFRLTSFEKMEFIFAASGVTEVEKVRPKKEFHTKAFLKDAGYKIARITQPCFITDAFCDVILANRCVIDFYNIPSSLLENAQNTIGGFNEIRYVFHSDSNFPAIIGEDSLERLLLVNARYFRRRTLRVRCKPYFMQLKEEFSDPGKYPSFERCWSKILFEEFDDFSFPVELPPNEDYEHSFISTDSLFALTPYGELYIHQLIPLNQKTANRMNKISQKVGEGYEFFANFPDKKKL